VLTGESNRNLIIAYQVNQIGMIKAIGAKIQQILFIYVVIVLVFAFLALVLAVPLGAFAAHGLRVVMVKRVGMVPGPFAISKTAVLAQITIVLLSPLLVSLVPILSGATITVREAISTYGVGRASGFLERLLVKLEFMPRMVTLTINNTFANNKRVLFTQLSLVGAGVVFMMVMNTRTTLTPTFGDALLSIYRTNVMLESVPPGAPPTSNPFCFDEKFVAVGIPARPTYMPSSPAEPTAMPVLPAEATTMAALSAESTNTPALPADFTNRPVLPVGHRTRDPAGRCRPPNARCFTG
jgi:hypothetical protein